MGFLDSLKKFFSGKEEQAEETQAPAPEQAPISEQAPEQAPEQTESPREQQPSEEGGSEERLP